MGPVNRLSPPSARSVYDAALQEAERHKWLASERFGRDLGPAARREWWIKYWPRFCRYRCIEHLSGQCQWQEFKCEVYGRLSIPQEEADLLVDRIFDRFVEGWENLTFACWLQEWDLPTERVLEILEIVDINATGRLAPLSA
jgi:hypothetical protein